MTKLCDGCRISNAAIFCAADMAYICLNCDLKVHGANKLASRHERVWVCEVCEHAPAAVICKADAAALCSSCDSDIHSANPLANRHERVAVTPFFECPSMVKVAHINASVADWNHPAAAAGFAAFNPEMFVQNINPPDSFLDFGRSVGASGAFLQDHPHDPSKSSSSFAAVPESSSNMSEISNPYPGNNIVDFLCQISADGEHHAAVAAAAAKPGVAREERVLRYKEKRKNRRFEKTVRYASRKAYAEIRPRIKGRFVKRSDVEQFVLSAMADSVVPSF